MKLQAYHSNASSTPCDTITSLEQSSFASPPVATSPRADFSHVSQSSLATGKEGEGDDTGIAETRSSRDELFYSPNTLKQVREHRRTVPHLQESYEAAGRSSGHYLPQ